MPMPAELRALILKFNQVGCLLESVDEDFAYLSCRHEKDGNRLQL
jgi:hypothetical protein